MNTKSITQSSNPVLAGSLPALRRSAKRAKKIAAQTGTRLIVASKPATHKVSRSAESPKR
jgi:hypothetical protein